MKKVLDNYQNKSLLLSFTIEWHEGVELGLEGIQFRNWHDVQEAFNKLYASYVQRGSLGYDKVKVAILWDNGKQIIDRIDVGNHGSDYCANRETVGEYLKRQKSVMHESNLLEGDRLNLLSFEDPGTTPKASKTVAKIELSDLAVNSAGKLVKFQTH